MDRGQELLNRLSYDDAALAEVVEILDSWSRIPADRKNGFHTLTVHETVGHSWGFHLAHTLWCDLSACAFDVKGRELAATGGMVPGVYRWESLDKPMELLSDSA